MPDTKPTARRMFVALEVHVSHKLSQMLDDLKSVGRGLRFVDERNLHLTLNFLGDVADERVPEITRGLDEIAGHTEPFAWQLRGTGAFPKLSRINVVWAGVKDEGQSVRLAEQVERLTDSLGFPKEQRPFTPHVTLARSRFRLPPKKLRTLLEESADRDYGPQQADTIVLFASELRPGGPRYTAVHRARFQTTTR